MPRYQFNRRARAALLDQLAAAGLPGLPVEMDGDYRPDGTIVNDTTCWVTCAPEQFDAVATVVAAHDVTVYDQQVQQEATRLAQAKQILRDYYVNSAPTNAQSVAAIKALIVAVRQLAQVDR